MSRSQHRPRGRRARAGARRRGYSQYAASKLTGVSPSMVSHYRTQRGRPAAPSDAGRAGSAAALFPSRRRGPSSASARRAAAAGIATASPGGRPRSPAEAIVPTLRHRHHRPARQGALLHTALRAQGLPRYSAPRSTSSCRHDAFDRAHRHHDPRFAMEIAPWVRRVVALNPRGPPPRSRCSSASNRITCGRAAATSDPTERRNDGHRRADARAARRARRARRPPDFPKLEAQLRSSGAARGPSGSWGTIETCDGTTGAGACGARDTEPDGILRKACGNRREAVCPPCAERYRQDAYHLISAGLRGGKGVPDTVAEHPAVFVTLTAPSFGVVHTRAARPGRPAAALPAAPRRIRSARTACRLSCGAVHDEDDPCLGEPLCPECFDYAGAVIWNNTLGELWRYTTIYLPRALARLRGMTQAALKRQVRPAYVKVAEYQRRGLVHLHVLVRLDRAMPDYRADEIHPPPRALRRRAARAARSARPSPTSRAPVADELGGGARALGRPARRPPARPRASSAARSPATWPSTRPRAPSRPAGCCTASRADEVDDAPVREHVRTLHARRVRARRRSPTQHAPTRGRAAARRRPTSRPTGTRPRSRSALRARWARDEPLRVRAARRHRAHRPRRAAARDRGRRATAPRSRSSSTPARACTWPTSPRSARPTPARPTGAIVAIRGWRACAHAFGYRGHCLTKSRRYSTTFKALREEREAFVHEQILARSRDATQRALAAATASGAS